MSAGWIVRTLVAATVLVGCASSPDCPPCRELRLEAESDVGRTLPYTLELEDSVHCEVVSPFGEPERLHCYCVNTGAQ
jgi:hypothetical protein